MHRNQFQSSARVLHATVRNVSKLLLLFHADSFLDLLFSSIFLLILKETKQVKDTLFSSELHFKLVNFSVFLSLDVKEILNQFLLLCFLPKSARFLSSILFISFLCPFNRLCYFAGLDSVQEPHFSNPTDVPITQAL